MFLLTTVQRTLQQYISLVIMIIMKERKSLHRLYLNSDAPDRINSRTPEVTSWRSNSNFRKRKRRFKSGLVSKKL